MLLRSSWSAEERQRFCYSTKVSSTVPSLLSVSAPLPRCPGVPPSLPPGFITGPLSCRNVTVPNRRISTKPTTKTIETAPPGWATALLRAIQPILGRSRTLLAQPFRTDGRRFAQRPFRPLSCGPLRPLDPPRPPIQIVLIPPVSQELTQERFGICFFFSFLLNPVASYPS